MPFAPHDFWLSLTLGLIPRFSRVIMVGFNPDIDNTGGRMAPVDVWPAPGDVRDYPFPSTAQSLEVVSDSVNDTAAGTGAQAVVVDGLDADFKAYATKEIAQLNGTTPVELSRTYVRINDFVVTTAGSTKRNEGNISCRVAGGGSVLGYIPAAPSQPEGLGRTQHGTFSVPVGYTAVILDQLISVHRATSAAVRVAVQVRNAVSNGAWIIPGSVTLSTQGQSVVVLSPRGLSSQVPGGTDIVHRCLETTAINVAVSTLADIVLYKLPGP